MASPGLQALLAEEAPRFLLRDRDGIYGQDFSAGGIGIDFASIAPALRQVFYIGDGVTGGSFQEFIAPAGATRLFLAIPDGFGFVGVPGAYDDNDGAYRVTIGVNRIPVVPLPAAAWLGLGLLGGLGVVRRLRGGTRNAA